MWLQAPAASGSVQPQTLIALFFQERAPPAVSCSMSVQSLLRSLLRDIILGRGCHAMFQLVRRGLTQQARYNQQNVPSSFAINAERIHAVPTSPTYGSPLLLGHSDLAIECTP